MITSGVTWGTPWIEETIEDLIEVVYQLYEDDHHPEAATWIYYSVEELSRTIPQNWMITA